MTGDMCLNETPRQAECELFRSVSFGNDDGASKHFKAGRFLPLVSGTYLRGFMGFNEFRRVAI